MACSLNDRDNHLEFLAVTALELKEKIQSLKEDENIDINQYVKDIYQEYIDDGFSEKDAAEYAQFVPNAIKMALSYDEVGFYIDVKQLRSLVKDFENFDNVLKFVKGKVLTEEEVDEIEKNDLNNSLNPANSNVNMSNDDYIIANQEASAQEREDRVERTKIEGAEDKTINRTKSKSKEERRNESGEKRLDKAIDLLYKSGAEIDSSGFIKLTENTDLDVIKKVVAAIVLFENNASQMTEVDPGKQRIIMHAINELNGEGYTIDGVKIGDEIVFGQTINISRQKIDPSSPNSPEIAQKKIITRINKAQILKDDKEIQLADVEVEIQNLSKEEIKNKIRLIENNLKKAESLGVSNTQSIKGEKENLQELKDFLSEIEEEIVYDATPSNIFSTISRRITKDTDEQILEDPNENFYSDFIAEFFIALNQSSNLAVNLTFGGHTGFKLKLVKANDINTLDENGNYIGNPNHVRKSHYDYVTDPNYKQYKYNPKTKRTEEQEVSLEKRIENHMNYGTSLVITDTDGNILYFTKDQNNKYQISDSQNGKPLYYNIRKEFGDEKQQNLGNFINTVRADEKANKELPKEATEEERNTFIQNYIKRTKEEIKLINGIISLATKLNQDVILDIESVNPGYIYQDFSKDEQPLSAIDWDNVSFVPTFRFGKNNQIELETPDALENIKIDSPKIKDTKYLNIIRELLTNNNLKYNDGFVERDMTVQERIDLINNYVFDKNISFKERNKKLIIEQKGTEISAEDFLNKIDNWFLNLSKTNNNNGKFNDVKSIENNVVNVKEINTKDYIIQNFYSHLVLGKYNTLPILGGYITFSIPSEIELQINPRKQETLEKVNIEPIAKRLPYDQVINIIKNVLLKQKEFIVISKEDPSYYEHIKDGKVIARYNRVTDIIDVKDTDLQIFSKLDRTNSFKLNTDPETGKVYYTIDRSQLTEKEKEFLDQKAEFYTGTEEEKIINLKTATEVGTVMDTILRDYFNGNIKTFSEYTNDLNFEPFANEGLFNEYINSLDRLQNYFNTNNLEVITDEIRLYSEEYGIAGTIDMLTVNRDTGEIGIIDLKTKKNLRYWMKGFRDVPSNFEKYSKQLSMYRIMLHNQNKLLAESLNVLVAKTNYITGEPSSTGTTVGANFTNKENPSKVSFVNEFFLPVDILDRVTNPNDIILQISEPVEGFIPNQTDETKEQLKELNKEKEEINEAIEESEKLIKRVEEKNLNEAERKRIEEEERKKEEEKRKENINKEVEKTPVEPVEEIKEDLDNAEEKLSDEEQEQILEKTLDNIELSEEEEKAVDEESRENESRKDTLKRLVKAFKAGKKKIKNATLKNLIHKIIKFLHIVTITSMIAVTTGAIGLKTGVIQKIASNDTINSFIAENVDPDVANVLTLEFDDIMDVGMNYYYKKTQTGPYSEEAVKNMELKIQQQAQEEEARLEALYEAQQIEEAEYEAEMERIRQEKLIFLKDPISFGQRVYTFKNGAHMKPAVVDIGTSSNREGVRFDIAHNVHASKRTYADQPNKTIPNSYGIIGAFHNKFVPYDQTSNHKFSVPVQITWNPETKVLQAKKTEELDSNDLVIPFGIAGTGNVTKLEDLEIKKLEDGSFDITTGIDKINGTSIIKSKKGKPFHIGLAPRGKERVLNSKDLKEYRPLRGGLVVIFDNDAEVAVLVTGSPNQIFSVIDELQKKHPEKKWNILKGDTGSYATSAFNTDGKTDMEDYKTYSNQNTYGQSQLLILLKPEKKKDTTPLNASLILFGLLSGLRRKEDFGTDITDKEISDLKNAIVEARERLEEINKTIATLQVENANENILINSDGLIIKENAIDEETSIEIVNEVKPVIEDTSYKQTKGATSFDMGLRWTRTNSLKGEKMIKSIIPGKQLNGKVVTQEMIDEAAKTGKFGKNWPLYVYSNLDRKGNKLPNIPTKIISLLEQQGIDISEYEASYNSVYDRKDKGSLVIHQDNTEQDSTYPIITISLGRPMKFITYELNDPDEFSLTDSETTPYQIAYNLVTKNLKSKPKYGVITPSNIIEYAKQAEKDSGNKNIVATVKDQLKATFKDSSRNEYILENGTVLIFSGNNRNVMHEIVFDQETDEMPMPAGFPTLLVNKAFTGLGHADRFKPTNDYRVVLTLRKVTPGKKGSSVVNESKFLSSNEPIEIDKTEAPQDKTEWTSKIGPNDQSSGVKKVYQGYDTLDGRKVNYYTINKDEASDYGKNVREVFIDISGMLDVKSNKLDYDGFRVAFNSLTGKTFDILDNSTEGLKTQNEFFNFLKRKGYTGLDFTGSSDNQYIVAFKNLEVQKDDPADYDALFRLKPGTETTRTETKRQIKRAEKWYNENMPRFPKGHENEGKLMLPFEAAYKIVNSNAYAEFTTQSILLYKGSNATDLYHEAWHGFTQLFLTPQERRELYEDVRKDPGTFKTSNGEIKKFSEASPIEIEEYLAEDFRHYGMSKGKIAKKGVRKNIFQKIWDFLFGWIGNYNYVSAITRPETLENIRLLQKNLYNGNIEQNKYDVNNAEWGVLAYGIEPVNENENVRSVEESLLINESVNMLLSDFINEQNERTGDARWTSAYLIRPELLYKFGYKYVLDKFIERRFQLIEDFKNETDLDKKGRLQNKIDILNFAINNFGELNNKNQKGVIAYNLKNNKQLNKAITSQIKFDQLDDQNELIQWIQTVEGSSNNLSSLDAARNSTINIIKSLHKYDSNGNVEKNMLGFPVAADFTIIWNRLQKTLVGSYNATEMWNRLTNEANTSIRIRNVINELKLKLGDPTNNEPTTLSEENTWSGFWQTFNKSQAPLEQLTINRILDEENNVSIDVTFGEASSNLSKIAFDITSNFKTLVDPNGYIVADKDGIRTLNFKKNSPLRRKYNSRRSAELSPYEFLYDIGIRLEDNQSIRNALSNKDIKNRVGWIYAGLEKLFNKNPNIKITDIIGNLMNTQSGNLNAILEIQLRYSDAYHSFMRNNAANEPQNIHTYNNEITVMINAINRAENFNELVNMPYMSFLAKNSNPYIQSNGILNAIFDLNEINGPRRLDKYGNPVKLELSNLSGLVTLINDKREDGVSNIDLVSYDKLIFDIHTLLLGGKTEIPRAETSRTSYAVNASDLKLTKYSPYLYVDLYQFYSDNNITIDNNIINNGIYKTISLLTNHLKSEIDRIIRINSGNEVEALNWTVGENAESKKLTVFSGMLSDKLIKKIEKSINIKKPNSDKIIDRYKMDIIKDMNVYLNNLIDETYRMYRFLPFIAPQLRTKYNNEIKDNFVDNKTDVNATRSIISAYVTNQLLNKFDLIPLFFGDLATYDMQKESFNKRNKGANSTGELFRTDPKLYNFLNSVMRQKYAESIGHNPALYNGIINSVITEDVIVKSERYEEYRRAWADHYAKIYPTKSNDEINKLVDEQIKPYSELNEGDGGAYATFDIYRFLSIQQDKWSPAQEELYNKIINKEPIDNINIAEFFPVRKYQYYGPMAVENGKMAPWVYHKYSVMPLIPGITAVGNLEKLHNKLVKSNNHYMTFESGSKLSIKTANEKLNTLYKNKVEPAKNREFNEDEVYVTNPIYVEYLKDQIEASSEYKGLTTFATQGRKVLISGLFNQGRALSDNISKLVDKYEILIKERTKRTEKLIKEQTGYDKNNNDLSGLISIIRSSLENGRLAPHEYESINVDEVTNELEIDFSLLLNSHEIEKLLISWANRNIIKQKFNGEMNVQVPNTGFEIQLSSELTDDQKQEYGTNGLRIYTREGVGENGLTLAAQTKIALQGDFKLLLKAEHLDGKVIGTLERLNEMLEEPEWLDINDHRKMITITGPRIPTAGPNMIEFFEIVEFLPEKAGNIIVLPSEIVAKSGTDFDYDKLSNYYMNIISVNGLPELVKNIDVKESKEELEERKDYLIDQIEYEKLKIQEVKFSEAFNNLSEELKQEYTDANLKFLNETIDLRKRISFLRNKWKNLNSIKNKIGKLIVQQNKIRQEIDQIQKQIDDISDKYKLHDIQLSILRAKKSKTFEPLYQELGEITRKLAALTTKGIDNEIIDVSIEIMKQPEYFLQLIEPLNSDKLEELASQLRESKKGKEKYSPYRDTRFARKDDQTYIYTDEKKHIKIFEPAFFINKHSANSVGMDVLGIYATNIPMKSLFNKVGMHISKLVHNYNVKSVSAESIGQGTTRGDAKDYEMRGKADGFIGELVEDEISNIPDNLYEMQAQSSTGFSYSFIGRKNGLYMDHEFNNNSSTVRSGTAIMEGEAQTIMLARNGEFRNIPLNNETKSQILKYHKDGATFIVGDMPGVDSYFVEYLQEIGAEFTVYTNGYNRLELFETQIPLPHNERSGKQLDLFDDQKNVGTVISLSNIYDVNNEYPIAYTNSAFLNGAVDIGHADWLFDINAGIENAPLISIFNNAGVSYINTVFYMSNPIIKYYNNRTRIQNALFFKVIPKNNIDIQTPFMEVLTALNLKNEYESFDTASAKMKYLIDYVNDYKKHFTTDTLKNIALNGIVSPLDKEISTALFISYYLLQERRGLADQYKQLIQTLNYDTSKPVSLYDIFYKNARSEDLLRLNEFPRQKLLRLRDESIISSFNTGPFQIEMWSNLFKITNHSSINDIISDLIFQERGRMMQSYGNMSKERFVSTFKQDLVNFIFQNVLHENNNISEGSKYGLDIIEKDVPSEIIDNIFDASQDEKIFALVDNNKIYLDRRRLMEEWKTNNNFYSEFKSFNDFKAYEIEKAYLRNIIKSSDLKSDMNFTNIYNNLMDNTQNPNEKTIIRKAYEIYIKNKALENLNNRHNNFISNNSYANRYMEIKNKYENELEEYIFIRNVHIDQGTTIKNLKLLERVKDEERIIAYHNSLIKLMDPNVKKVSNESENNMISEFFQKFPIYAYLQTGPNTSSPLSFMRIIDQKHILDILRSVQDEVIDNLNGNTNVLINDKTINDFLDAFNYQRSTSNSSNAFRSLDYIGKQERFIDSNIAIKMDTETPQYILMNTKVASSIEKYKNNSNITFVLTGNQNKNKVFYDKYEKNVSKEVEEGRVKVLSLYSGQTKNLTLSDNNLENNKKSLLEDIEEIKNIRDNGNTLIFLSEGYSALKNDAPQTNLWLLNQLKDNFQYIDLSLNSQYLNINTSNKLLRDNINEVLDETLQELKKC